MLLLVHVSIFTSPVFHLAYLSYCSFGMTETASLLLGIFPLVTLATFTLILIFMVADFEYRTGT